MSYNPFSKAIGEALDPEDLNILIEQAVSEGYYVEYKGQLPSTTKIARSLASFANTYGGWYIAGVETNEHNVAESIPGFDAAVCHDPISVIREVAKHHVDPVPLIFPQVVKLADESLVLVVHVPDNQDTPFITKDGRVYRRTHDSSDPVPEGNRYAFDQLVQRGKVSAARFAEFSRDDRSFSEAEKENAWLNIYLSPTPFRIIHRPDIRSEEEIQRLMELSKRPASLFSDRLEVEARANVPLNTGYSAPSSVILRQITELENQPFNGLTIEFDVYGRARIHIPLPQVPTDERSLNGLHSDKVRDHLRDQISSLTHATLFDFGKVSVVAMTLIRFYTDWIGDPPVPIELEAAIEFDGVWRHVPLFDQDSWADHVERFGLPMQMRDNVRYPDRERQSFRIEDLSDVWIAICGQMALSIGLPATVFTESLVGFIGDLSQGQSPEATKA